MGKPVATSSESVRPGRPAASGRFVGRKRETDELRSALEDALSGNGQLVMLVGEPGIGKTTLAGRLTTEAGERGAQVFWGRCWEGRGVPAFWPWIQVLRACACEQDPALLASLIGSGASELSRLLPQLGARSEDAVAGPGRPVLASDDDEHARFRLFDSVTGFLQRTAARKPLLIVLDDCHEADEASLLLLQFLSRNLRQSPIMVVVTYREPEVSLNPRLADLLGNLGREGRTMTLRGIAESDVQRLVELSAGHRPDPEMVSALYQATEGNPFFLTEILRLLITEGKVRLSGAAAPDTFEIPESLRAAIRRRLRLVSQRTRTTLDLAAVVGRDFELGVLQRVTGLGVDELNAAMEEAVGAALVSVDSDTRERYRFRHALIPETIYSDLAKTLRRRLHLQIATALEELYAHDLEPHLSELAHHYAESLQAGRVSSAYINKAIDYASGAAQRAQKLLAYEEAVHLYRMALKAIEHQHKAGQQRRCELSLGLADSLLRAGLFEQSREAFNRAAEIARNVGNAGDLARAALGISMYPTDPGNVDQTKVAALEESLEAMETSDTPLRAMVLARLAREFHWSDIDRGQALSHRAVEMARGLDDKTTLIYVLINRHLAAWGPDNLEERLALASEAVALCEDSENIIWAPHARYLRMVDQLEMGDVEAVDQDIEYYSRVTEKLWLPAGFRERAQAVRALMEGRFEESEGLARQARALGKGRLQRRAQMAFGNYLMALRRQQGRLTEFEPALTTVPVNSPSVQAISRCWRALCWSETGRLAEARAQLELLAADGFASVRRDETWLCGISWLVETCSCFGDVGRAASLYHLLCPYAARNVVSDLNACYGSVEHYLGILSSTMSRFEQAQPHFEAALRFNTRMRARPFVAQNQYEYAAMLLKRGQAGDRDRALDLLGAALKTAQALGMARLGQKAQGLHATVGVLVPGGTKHESPIVVSEASGVQPQRMLATVLFTDIVGSTQHAAKMGDRRFGAILDSYYALARKQFAIFEGREMGTTGDGILAIFNSPAHAIKCACAIRDRIREFGIEIRAGLHTGECEVSDEQVRGIAVHIGARVVSAAAPGEVLVSSTVKDLVAGADLSFIDRGLQPLKGVPGKWHLFRAELGVPSPFAQDAQSIQAPGSGEPQPFRPK